jgi:hypothetical protein
VTGFYITRIAIPDRLFREAHQTLHHIGQDECEGLVLWVGTRSDDESLVTTIVRPTQRCIKTEAGLLVVVEGRELHRLNVWLYERGLQMLAQVHTHPTDAYHSPTDDAIPIVTTPGGYSLVVPDFAYGPADLGTYACYRLSTEGTWSELSMSDVNALIRVIPDLM